MAPNTGPVEISFEKPETAGVQTKHDLVEHVEGETSTSSIASPAVAPLPPVEQLGLVACIKRYRYATLICVLAAVGALSDGYQVQMSGSIIALKGFIRQFGDEREDGTYKIKPYTFNLSLKAKFWLHWSHLTSGKDLLADRWVGKDALV